MKLKLSLLILFLPVLCYGQEFLDYPDDYLVGHSIAKTEAAADSLALISLAREFYTDVVSETSSKFYDDGRSRKQTYSNNVELKTRIRIAGAKKYVNRIRRGEYEVYRYFNKKEYVEERIYSYTHYLNEAERYRNSDYPHRTNLVLGSMYNAYVSLNDTLLSLLYPKSVNLKETLKREIKTTYDLAEHVYLWNSDSHGKMIKEQNNRPLLGFEYMSKTGEWVVPIVFKEIERQEVTRDDKKKRWACVDNLGSSREYHVLYEELEMGRYVKIVVPEEFYFPDTEKYF